VGATARSLARNKRVGWALAALFASLLTCLRLVDLSAEAASAPSVFDMFGAFGEATWPKATIIIFEGLLTAAALLLIVNYTVSNVVLIGKVTALTARVEIKIAALNKQVSAVEQEVTKVKNSIINLEGAVANVQQAVERPVPLPADLVSVDPVTRTWIDKLSRDEVARFEEQAAQLKSEVENIQRRLVDADAQLRDALQRQSEQEGFLANFGPVYEAIKKAADAAEAVKRSTVQPVTDQPTAA
jgi:peptidoglycan hydrolase CwlO-like protein